MSDSDQQPEADATEDTSSSSLPKEPRFTFTDPGCRSEIRLGGLLVLAAVFLWQWWLALAQAALVIGLPLVIIGIPLQVRDARQRGRPGYPWKLGLTMTILGLFLLPDQFYRESVDGPLRLIMPWVPALLAAGLWMLLWWPWGRPAVEVEA